MAGRTARRRARENLGYLLVILLVFCAMVAWNRWQDHRREAVAGVPAPSAAPAPAGPGADAADPDTTAGPGGNPPIPAGAQPVTVDHPLDGDSLRVRASAEGAVIGTREPVDLRLLGIDAPETHGAGGQPQCYSGDAYQRLRRLAPPGATLLVAADRQPKDPYDRYLVYAWTADGTFVNLDQARLGFARALDIPPNDAYAGRIGAAVDEARAHRRGLWGTCVATPG